MLNSEQTWSILFKIIREISRLLNFLIWGPLLYYSFPLCSYLQLLALPGTSKKQEFKLGQWPLLFISLILTIKIANYQPHKPVKFKRGTRKSEEIICLLKLKKKTKQKPYFRNSKSPCWSYRNEALIPQAKQKKASSENFNRHQRAENREDWRIADEYAQLYLHIKISARAWTQSCKRGGSTQGDDLIKFLPGLHYLLQFLISSAKLKLACEEKHFKTSVLYLLHTPPILES